MAGKILQQRKREEKSESNGQAGNFFFRLNNLTETLYSA